MVTYILARKAQLAGDMADAGTAVDLADAALASAQPGSRLAAVAPTYGAFGYALNGDTARTARALDLAMTLLENAEQTAEPSGWAPWLDRTYIEVQAGRCHARLGQHVQAIASFQHALDSLPPDYRRDRGVYLARQARAHVGAGDIEHATTLGMEAIDIAFATGSQRITTELAHVDIELAQWSKCPAVTDFKDALNTVLLHEA